MTEMMSFDVHSLDWERGVEYGLLFARVKYNARVSTYPLHADLAEQAQLLADMFGHALSTTPHVHDRLCEEQCIGRHDCEDGETWLDITLSPRRTGRLARERSPRRGAALSAPGHESRSGNAWRRLANRRRG
jgi:hypothetical protein